ncbi:MAG: hypothetical protein FJ137_01555 [Deltaproteobacteria bacterium]|nr:hypothetical protein [Deltaproteobacteria bacterium]
MNATTPSSFRCWAVVAGAACAAGAVAAVGCALPLDVTLDAVPPLPVAPQLAEATTPTCSTTAVLRGTRPANTSLLIDDEEVVPRDGSTAFRVVVPLPASFNTFALQALDAVGRASDATVITIVRDDLAPGPIVFDAPPAARTARVLLTLSGAKDPSCVMRQDGRVLADVDPAAPFFSIEQEITLGANRFRWSCADNAGNESAVTQIDIERFAVRDIPFSLDQPPPPTTTTTEVILSATCEDDVEVQATGVGVTRCAQGAWQARIPLVDGPNTISVRAAFVGELDAAAKPVGTFLIDADLSGSR